MRLTYLRDISKDEFTESSNKSLVDYLLKYFFMLSFHQLGTIPSRDLEGK